MSSSVEAIFILRACLDTTFEAENGQQSLFTKPFEYHSVAVMQKSY